MFSHFILYLSLICLLVSRVDLKCLAGHFLNRLITGITKIGGKALVNNLSGVTFMYIKQS